MVFGQSTPTTGAIAAGWNHGLLLKSNGELWTAGSNESGQLGIGGGAVFYPVRPLTTQNVPISGVAGIAAGYAHSLALKTDGTVLSWGDNSVGQLGQIPPAYWCPEPIAGLSGILQIAAGFEHSLAVKSDGSVWSWGWNFRGQLGDGTTTDRPAPVQVTGLTSITAVAAGRAHSVALRNDGTVWAWGLNTSGQLGDGTTTQRTSAVQVTGLSGITAIACGNAFSLALKSDGTVWTWGQNVYGQLGDGTTIDRLSPVQVPSTTGVAKIAAGGWHSMAVKTDGTLWVWGDNYYGQLGDGNSFLDSSGAEVIRVSPYLVSSLSGIVGVAGASGFSMALKSDGTVSVWGDNSSGQFADGRSTLYKASPVQVGTMTTVVSVAAGRAGNVRHGIAAKSDGTVWSWGSNDSGRLGDGTTLDRIVPAQVSGLNQIGKVSAGSSHGLALKSDGTVWGWGCNSSGQVGDGTTTNRSTPAQIAGFTGVIAVASGEDHNLAQKNDGTVWSWGRNEEGQLGDGSRRNRSSPVQVSGLSSVTSVGAGYWHSFAIKTDGTLWAWGSNDRGQLGDGTHTNRQNPVQVSGLSGVVAATGGTGFSIALKNDGTVWTWGTNNAGQWGNGSATNNDTALDRLAPAQVPGLTGIVKIAAGSGQCLALKSDGSVWGWGGDSWGQLGSSTTAIERLSPIQATGLTGVVSLSGGYDFTLAVNNDGTLRGFGQNSNFALAHDTGVPLPTRAAIRLISSTDDTDQDGMSDTWELQYFGNLSRNGTADYDNDGLTDIQEFARGGDPLHADIDLDLLTDFVDPYPADYYNGAIPTLAVIGGNNQSGYAGQFNAQAFDVAVFNTAGTTPLVNAPLTFSVQSGSGQLATTNIGSPSLSVTLDRRTDINGTAQSFYKHAGSSGVASQIWASAGNATPVSFTTTSVPSDSDGDGLFDGWEITHFGNLNQGAAGDPDGDGLTNLQEFQQGSNPNLADTDGDGMTDGQEYLLGRNPTKGLVSDTTGAVNLRLFTPSR